MVVQIMAMLMKESVKRCFPRARMLLVSST
jgi:hypothetical protein